MHDLSEIKLRKVLLTLGNSVLAGEISNLVLAEVNGTISICFPKICSQKNKIHFLIDSDRKLSLFDTANLTTLVKEKLGFDYTDDEEDYDILVELKNVFEKNKIDEFFYDITPFSKENIKNVQSFLRKNYPQFFGSSESETFASSSFSSLFTAGSQLAPLQQLADRLFQSNAAEIERLSPREREEFVKTFCKKLGIEVDIKPQNVLKV